MNKDRVLDPLVSEMIKVKLKCIDKDIDHSSKYIEDLERDLFLAKNQIRILRTEKTVYENILKTGDARFAVPSIYEPPKEFKVRK